MHLSWLGTTAVKIQAKPFDEDVIIVIDPYRPDKGNFPRSLTPHIALFSRGDTDAITLSGDPFVLATPGECEVKGVLITSIPSKEEGKTLLRLDTEQLSVAHLGLVNHDLLASELEALGDVDILFVPVGGNGTYDAEAAVKAVSAIEPKIVIPMAYQSDNDPSFAAVTTFLKEMGTTSDSEEKKIIIKKKDLPMDETKVMVLGKE
ncbi:MAG TPA: MBL fold metallo-hydrolase [Candidatus Kapabacteria bacterium]|nr:MBL fold metallo-hydrolase [Candidatus Kapabacteria bacterium]